MRCPCKPRSASCKLRRLLNACRGHWQLPVKSKPTAKPTSNYASQSHLEWQTPNRIVKWLLLCSLCPSWESHHDMSARDSRKCWLHAFVQSQINKSGRFALAPNQSHAKYPDKALRDKSGTRTIKCSSKPCDTPPTKTCTHTACGQSRPGPSPP
jgi:hypothetical protein